MVSCRSKPEVELVLTRGSLGSSLGFGMSMMGLDLFLSFFIEGDVDRGTIVALSELAFITTFMTEVEHKT